MKTLEELRRKKVSLEDITHFYHLENYLDLYNVVMELIHTGKVKPIVSSKTNGKKPALYNWYKVIAESKDNRRLIDEMQFSLHPSLNIDYYIEHIESYMKDREYILKLSDYLRNKKEFFAEPISLNERSFEIWGREKFLQKEGGKRILKNVGLDLEDLNIYPTTEPLAYYSHYKETPQKVLILENKDTFYSMRRHLLNGNQTILGAAIGTLIYGGGKSIHKAFSDFQLCVEPYISHPSNEILYFGDLDYEGILIYEKLQKIFQARPIIPFIKAYERMLVKGDGLDLPSTKEGQNRNIGTRFLSYFTREEQENIVTLLEQGKYIPQESINANDL